MSARAKWELYFAKIKEEKIIPLYSTKDYGEGCIDIARIKREIIPLIQEKNLRLPIVIKTYFSKKTSGSKTVLRGGEVVFKPAIPIRENFSFLITSNLEIINLSNCNIENLEDL